LRRWSGIQKKLYESGMMIAFGSYKPLMMSPGEVKEDDRAMIAMDDRCSMSLATDFSLVAKLLRFGDQDARVNYQLKARRDKNINESVPRDIGATIQTRSHSKRPRTCQAGVSEIVMSTAKTSRSMPTVHHPYDGPSRFIID
jgi:hypothetical protein